MYVINFNRKQHLYSLDFKLKTFLILFIIGLSPHYRTNIAANIKRDANLDPTLTQVVNEKKVEPRHVNQPESRTRK